MLDLKNMLIEAGYPKNEMFHWYSDLYVFVTPLTAAITKKWAKANGFSLLHHRKTFKDNITGKLMYECYFCWHE